MLPQLGVDVFAASWKAMLRWLRGQVTSGNGGSVQGLGKVLWCTTPVSPEGTCCRVQQPAASPTCVHSMHLLQQLVTPSKQRCTLTCCCSSDLGAVLDAGAVMHCALA
jgi:hypothetical protein